jgi:plastocyanin
MGNASGSLNTLDRSNIPPRFGHQRVLRVGTRKLRTGAFALIAGAVALCGTARAADNEMAISIKDHQFVPSELAAPAGQKLKIVVKNEGKTPSEFESVDFHREKVVPSGHEATVFVGPLDPGIYEFFDDFHPETRGRLVVK